MESVGGEVVETELGLSPGCSVAEMANVFSVRSDPLLRVLPKHHKATRLTYVGKFIIRRLLVASRLDFFFVQQLVTPSRQEAAKNKDMVINL